MSAFNVHVVWDKGPIDHPYEVTQVVLDGSEYFQTIAVHIYFYDELKVNISTIE